MLSRRISLAFLLVLALLSTAPALAQPTFSGLSPADGVVLGSTTGTLSGTASGATSLSIDGQSVTLAGDGSFSYAYSLGEGSHTFQLHADDGTNSTDITHTLVIDTLAPGLTVSSPAQPTVGASPVLVAGSLQEPHPASVTVGGQAATLDGNNWSIALPISEGSQTLSVVATDTLGHTSSLDLGLVLDSIAPTVTISEGGSAFSGGLYNRPVVPTFTVSDATETTVTALLDGSPFVSGTTVSTEGAHTLDVTATDSVGHSTPVSVSFTIDTTPPSIGTITPASGSLLGTATASLTVEAPGASRVTAGGVEALGTTPFTLSSVPLAEGETTLLVEAFDDAGNRVERQHRLVRDTTAPQLTISAPSASDVLSSATVTVSGIAADLRLASVTVDGLSANLVGDAFSRDITLVEGSNTITVIATDTAGNSDTATVTVSLDSAAPTFQVLVNSVPLVSGATFSESISPTIQVDDPTATVDATLNGGTFASGDLVDIDGQHELAVTVTSTGGVSASALYVFTIDRQTPSFLSITPPDGHLQSASEVTLSGSVANAARVTVDGQEATVFEGDFVAGPFTLAEGSKSFSLVAIGRNGLETTTSHTIRRDATAPTLQIGSPAADVVLGEVGVDVSGTAADEHLDSVTVNGTSATISGSSYIARSVPLTEGPTPTVLTVRATDAAGNFTEAEREVVRDTTAPVIAITEPASGSIVPDATYTIRGSITEPHPDRIDVVRGDGTSVRGTISGNEWSAIVTLADGPNDFTATARDQGGQTADATVTIHRDSDAPNVAIVLPADGAHVNGSTVEVRGTVDNEDGMQVRVNSLLAVDDQGSWVVDVPLPIEGENLLTARATDAQGNSGVHKRTIVRDTGAPGYVGAQPAAGSYDLPLSTSFRLRFSEAMAAPEVGALTLAVSGGAAIPFTVSVEGDELVVNPDSALPQQADLVLTLTTALEDLAGNGLATPPAALTFSTVDAGAPPTPTLSFAVASRLCANSVTFQGTAEPGSTVTVAGAASAGSQRADDTTGAFLIEVDLTPDRLHAIEITASDFDGNTSAPLTLEIAQDCRAPRVLSADLAGDQLTIEFDESVDGSTVGGAITLTDDTGVVPGTPATTDATVTVTLSATPVGTASLEVATTITDLAGNTLAYPYRQLFGDAGGDSFFSGTVIDDATGRPLAGAVVQVTSTDGVVLSDPVPQQTTGADGRFLVTVPAGTHDVSVQRPGYTPVFRVVTTATGQGTNVFDPRPTPIAAPDGATAHLQSGSLETESGATLTIPAGALAQTTAIAITTLGEQGLSALLPYGWSPRGSAWVDIGQNLSADATLDLPVSAGNGTALDIVSLDFTNLQWQVIAQATVAGGAVSISVDAPGAFAVVQADIGALAPPAAVIGQVLGSSAAPNAGAVASASLSFDPEIVFATQRSEATATYTLNEAIPSGVPLTLSIHETLTLQDGSTLEEAPYSADLVVYHSSSGTARSYFWLQPSATARSVALESGSEDVTVRAYGDETVRGNVLGPDGGAVLDDQGDRLDVPAGALAGPSAVVLTRKTAADLPLAVPAAGTVAGVIDIDLGGAVLASPGRLELNLGTAPAAGAVGLLLHVIELDDGDGPTETVYRVVAEIEPTVSGWASKTIDPADLAWPGVREGGLYAFLELTTDHGFVRGTVLDTDSQPVAGAVVRAASVEWVQLSGADGSYVLPLPVDGAQHTLEIRDPASGNGLSVSVTAPTTSGERIDLDLPLQVVGPWVQQITPIDGATAVPIGFEPTVVFSEPVERTSLDDGVVLEKSQSSSWLPVEITLDHLGDRITVIPAVTLEPGADYRLTVGTEVRDLDGYFLASPVQVTFTTDIDPNATSNLDPSKVRLFAPDHTGMATIVGQPGSVPSQTLVYVENLSSYSTTESITSEIDGSFTLTIGATVDDQLLLHVLIPNASEDLLALGPYLASDERAAYIWPQGAVFTTVDGIEVAIEDGTFPASTWVRVDPKTPGVSPTGDAPAATSAGFEALDAFDLDLGGNIALKPIHISMAIPAGVTAADDVQLHRYLSLLDARGWMLHDFLRLDGGRITTEPATKAAARTKSDGGPRTSYLAPPARQRTLPADLVRNMVATPGTVVPAIDDPTAQWSKQDAELKAARVLTSPVPPELAAYFGEDAATARAGEKGNASTDPTTLAVGVTHGGYYQVAKATVPMAYLVVPAIAPDLLIRNKVFDPPMLSLIDQELWLLGHRHFLLPTPAAEAEAVTTGGAASKSISGGYDLAIHDVGTGFLLYSAVGDAPPDGLLEFAPDAYEDTIPPVLVDGSPFTFVRISTWNDGEVEIAPGIKATVSENALAVSGESGTAVAEAHVVLFGYANGQSASVKAKPDGSFTINRSIEANEPHLLAIGAVLGPFDQPELVFSEAVAATSDGVPGISIHRYQPSGQPDPNATALRFDRSGIGESVSFRPVSGWGNYEYQFRIGTGLEDLSGNSWPAELRLDFETAGAAVIDDFGFDGFSDMARLGHLLFVASGNHGLRILDVRDPAAPEQYLGLAPAFTLPFQGAMRGVDVDPHGFVYTVGGGEAGFGQLNVFDPLGMKAAQDSGGDPYAAAKKGSMLVSNPLTASNDTPLTRGLPQRVAVASLDKTTTWQIEMDVTAGDHTGVTVEKSTTLDPLTGAPLITVSGTDATPGRPVTVRNLTRGRLVREIATDNTYSIDIEALPGEWVEVRRNEGVAAYVAVNTLAQGDQTEQQSLFVVDVVSFWQQDIDDPQMAADFVEVIDSSSAPFETCDPNRVGFSRVPTDLGVLVDSQNSRPLALATLIPGFGVRVLTAAQSGGTIDFAELDQSPGGDACARVEEINDRVNLSGMTLVPQYPMQLAADGPPELRDYILVSHLDGYIVIFDATARTDVRRVATIPIGKSGERIPISGLEVDRRGRRIFAAAFGGGVYEVDFDILYPDTDGRVDANSDSLDDRILGQIDVGREEAQQVTIIPEIGVGYVGGREVGLTSLRIAPPELSVLAADAGRLRRVERVAPFGTPTTDEYAIENPEPGETSTKVPGAIRLHAHVPGLGTNGAPSAFGNTIEVDLVSVGPGGQEIDGFDPYGVYPDLPKTSYRDAEALVLFRAASEAWETGSSLYLSKPVVLIADLRASIAYAPTTAEEKPEICRNCDQINDAEGETQGVYTTAPAEADRFPELLSGHSLVARFSSTMHAELAAFYDNVPVHRQEVVVDSVPWDISPSLTQEPPHSPSYGFGHTAPGTLLHSLEFSHEVVDLSLPAQGLPFAFARTYRNQTVGGGPLGPGWDLPFRMRLRQLPDGSVDVFDGRGRRETFAKGTETQFVAPPGNFVTLRRTAQGYTLADRSRTVARFDLHGRLFSIFDTYRFKDEDGYGTEMFFHYDGFSRLVGIEQGGRTMTLEYNDEGLLTELVDDTGRDVLFAYDGQGRLASVSSPEVELSSGDTAERLVDTYTYASPSGDDSIELNQRDNLISLTDPKGTEWLSLTYAAGDDSYHSRLESQDWGGQTVGLEIDDSGSDPVTKVTDRRGFLQRYTHSAEGYLKELQDPDTEDAEGNVIPGAKTKWAPNEHGLSTSTEMPDGRTLEYSYVGPVSPSAQLSAIERPNLTERKIVPGPGASGSPIPEDAVAGCQIDLHLNGSGAEQIWAYANYDPKTHQPGSVQGPDQSTSFTFHADTGAFVTSTQEVPDAVLPDVESLVRKLTSSLHGFVQRVETGPLVRELVPYSDPDAPDSPDTFLVGQQIIDPDGLKLTTNYHYDKSGSDGASRGFLTEVEKPEGIAHKNEYNALGWLLKSCRQLGSQSLCDEYTYDANGNITQIEKPDGASGSQKQTLVMAYGASDELLLTSITGHDGATWIESRTYYEDLSLKQVDPTGTAATFYDYDARGLLVAEKALPEDPNDPDTEYGVVTQYQYDSSGRLIQVTNPVGATSRAFFDGYGRPAMEVDAEGHYRLTSYDNAGNPTQLRSCSSAGELLSHQSQEWDQGNRLKIVEDWLYPTDGSGDPPEAKITTYGTNALSQVETVEDSRGVKIASEFDSAQRLKARTIEDGAILREAYDLDKAGRPKAIERTVPKAGGGTEKITTQAVWDSLSRMTSMTDASGRKIENRFDAQNRILGQAVSQGGQKIETAYQYDGLGRPKEVARPEGVVVRYAYSDGADSQSMTHTDALGQVTTYTYDTLGRLTTLAYPDGTQETVTYDPVGNPTTQTQPNGTVYTHTFDLLGRMTNRTITPATGIGGATAETFGWDGLGRQTAVNRGGTQTTYGYDSLSRRISETTLGKQLAYSYDDQGNVVGVGYPSSFDLVREWTPHGRLESVKGLGQATADATYSWSGSNVERTVLGNLGQVDFSYDSARNPDGRTATIGGVALLEERLGLNERGLRTVVERIDLSRAAWDLELDQAGRLKKANRIYIDSSGNAAPNSVATPSSLPTSYAFEYDTAQNLLRRTENRGCVDLSVDLPLDGSKRNRPGQVGEQALKWDTNGNLIEKGDWNYTYDNRNRLVEIDNDGVTVATYTYDAFDRRTTRTVGGTTYRTVWDGWRPVEEYEDDVLKSRRIYGVGLDEVVRLEQDIAGTMKAYVPIYDSMGNVALVLDDQGVPIERYDYSPFGERAIRANDFVPPAVEQVRIENGEIWVELSELSTRDILEAAVADQLKLHNSTKGVDVVFDPEVPVNEGRQAHRRLVLKPSNLDAEEPDLEDGDQLELTIEAAALVDIFGNEGVRYTSDPFTWSPTGTVLVEDNDTPKLTEVCWVDNKLTIDFSEPVTTQAASTVLKINGAQKLWTPVHDGYGVQLLTALQEGSYTLTFGTDPLDLADKPLDATAPIAFTAAATPVDELLHSAPYPGEVATSTIGNAFGFHGLLLDEESGLIYARHRFFDSELGRFTQPDPLGYVDGPSAYQFAGYNPYSFNDPLGLCLGMDESSPRPCSEYLEIDLGLTDTYDDLISQADNPQNSIGDRGVYLAAATLQVPGVLLEGALNAPHDIVALVEKRVRCSGLESEMRSNLDLPIAGRGAWGSDAGAMGLDPTSEEYRLESAAQQFMTFSGCDTTIGDLAALPIPGKDALRLTRQAEAAGKFRVNIRYSPASYYSYRELKTLIKKAGLSGKGLGFEAHHLLEKRFAKALGLKQGDIISVPLTPTWHRNVGGQGVNISDRISQKLSRLGVDADEASPEQIWQAHRDVYTEIGHEDWAAAIYDAYFFEKGISYR